MKKFCCTVFGKYRKFKNNKISYIFKKKHQFFLLFAASAKMNMEKYFKKKNQMR